jgi:hypothetical protein
MKKWHLCIAVVSIVTLGGYYYEYYRTCSDWCETQDDARRTVYNRPWCSLVLRQPCEYPVRSPLATSLGAGFLCIMQDPYPRRTNFTYATCDNKTTFSPMPALLSYAIEKNTRPGSCRWSASIYDLLWEYESITGRLLRYLMDALEYFSPSGIPVFAPLPYSSRARDIVLKLARATAKERIYYEVLSGPWKDVGCKDKTELGCLYPSWTKNKNEPPVGILRVHVPDEGYCWSYMYSHNNRW